MVAGSEEKMEVVSEENGGTGFSFKGFRGSIVGSSGDSLRGTGTDVEGKMGQVWFFRDSEPIVYDGFYIKSYFYTF